MHWPKYKMDLSHVLQRGKIWVNWATPNQNKHNNCRTLGQTAPYQRWEFSVCIIQWFKCINVCRILILNRKARISNAFIIPNWKLKFSIENTTNIFSTMCTCRKPRAALDHSRQNVASGQCRCGSDTRPMQAKDMWLQKDISMRRPLLSMTLQWCVMGVRYDVLYRWQLNCLFNRLHRKASLKQRKRHLKRRITGPLWGDTGGFPSQRASKADQDVMMSRRAIEDLCSMQRTRSAFVDAVPTMVVPHYVRLAT